MRKYSVICLCNDMMDQILVEVIAFNENEAIKKAKKVLENAGYSDVMYCDIPGASIVDRGPAF